MTDENVNPNAKAHSTKTSLLEQVRVQNQAAWERLVGLYAPLVYQWCRQSGLQPTDAAEAGAEVFRVVARKIAEFQRQRDGDTFRGWLRIITRNKLRDHAQWTPGGGGSSAMPRQRADAAADPLPDNQSSVADDDCFIYGRALELIRAEFDDNTWQAFWRVAVGQRAPEEVASELKLTVNEVYLAKSRIRRRLREEFADLLET